MAEPVILIVGHGSNTPQAISQFNDFNCALAAHTGLPTQHAFLELAQPDLTAGMTHAVESSHGEIVILPLFLGSAGHQKNDVAVAVQWARRQFPKVNFHYAAPLGPHAKLIELMSLRVQEAMGGASASLEPEKTAVLVVGRGSSDPDSNGEIARSAYLLWEKRPYHNVEYAFQAVARPNVLTGMQRCKALGAHQIVVSPYLLFTGQVEDDIQNRCQAAALEMGLPILIATHLGVHPLLLEVAAQRIEEALNGKAAMTCDLCKYRLPMSGYESQVGTRQTSHHFQAS